VTAAIAQRSLRLVEVQAGHGDARCDEVEKGCEQQRDEGKCERPVVTHCKKRHIPTDISINFLSYTQGCLLGYPVTRGASIYSLSELDQGLSSICTGRSPSTVCPDVDCPAKQTSH